MGELFNRTELEKQSRELSYVLRHNPSKIGVELEVGGWVAVDKVLSGLHLTLNELEEIVRTDDKKRYSFSEDRTKIRANQGHSVEVEMDFEVAYPLSDLYHGTVMNNIGSILKDGLKKMKRQYVHLSDEYETAVKVASRRKSGGGAVILLIDARKMANDGYEFMLSENEVWLVDSVPAKYITVLE